MSSAAVPRPVNDGVPGLDVRDVFQQKRRREQMRAAWDAYRGDWGPGPLRVDPGQPDDNVRVNRCAPIVDKGVSFLFGKPVGVEVSDPDGGTDGAAEALQNWLDAAWGDTDDRMTLLSKLAMNGAVCGHAFLKVVPANPKAGQTYPRLVVLDPQTITVQTDPDDCETVRSFTIEYDSYDPQTQAATQRRQVIARVDPDGLAALSGGMDSDDTWTITNYVRAQGAGSSAWTVLGEPVKWPYPQPPIVAGQNLPNPNEYWGLPDLTPDLIDGNRILNFIESNISRIIKMHAHPWPWASGVDPKAIVVDPGRIIGLPHPESRMGFLEMHGDLASSMNFAEDIRSNMDEQSRVPAVALGRLKDLPRGAISGVALQLLFQPLIEKTVLKQRLYGRLIRDVSRLMLVVSGFPADAVAAVKIEPHWQNLLPVDDLAAAQTALALQQVGVSRQTLLRQLGYDPDAEAEKVSEDGAQQAVAFSRGQGMPPATQGSQGAQPEPSQPDAPQDAASEQGG